MKLPVDQETTVSIKCDNPACPGNQLDPTDRTGWLFINWEIYGQQTNQHVFCSFECLAASAINFIS